MFDNFTPRARKVIKLANLEAHRFDRAYIGAEHILLGLLLEGSGIPANVLMNLDVDLRKLRAEVGKLDQGGPDTTNPESLPGSVKRAVESATEEAASLRHNYIGPEHLLLGLLRQEDSAAVRVLVNLGLTGELVRGEVLNLLGCQS